MADKRYTKKWFFTYTRIYDKGKELCAGQPIVDRLNEQADELDRLREDKQRVKRKIDILAMWLTSHTGQSRSEMLGEAEEVINIEQAAKAESEGA